MDPTELNMEVTLLHEISAIRRLMEEYFHSRDNIVNSPRSMPGDPYSSVTTRTPDDPRIRPPRPPPIPEPIRVKYANVVTAVREVIDRRSPSQLDEPLKPSQIDPALKHVYERKFRTPVSSSLSTTMGRPPLPLQQQRRRRSSQMSTPPVVPSTPPLSNRRVR